MRLVKLLCQRATWKKRQSCIFSTKLPVLPDVCLLNKNVYDFNAQPTWKITGECGVNKPLKNWKIRCMLRRSFAAPVGHPFLEYFQPVFIWEWFPPTWLNNPQKFSIKKHSTKNEHTSQSVTEMVFAVWAIHLWRLPRQLAHNAKTIHVDLVYYIL